MATGQYQNAAYAVPGGDLPVANFGTSADIPEGRVVLIDTTNQESATQPVGVMLPTASGGVAGTYGITITTLRKKDATTGKFYPGRVRVLGSYWVPADGSITAGNYLQASDTSGKLGYVKASGAATEQIGQAITSAADGELVHVLIAKAKNA